MGVKQTGKGQNPCRASWLLL